MTLFGQGAAGISTAVQILGGRNDPYTNFSFFVEIEGLIVGGFSEVSGLQSEVELTPYREGGLNNYIHQLPGPTRYPQNISLKHGLTANDLLWSWYEDVTQGNIQRKNGSIFLLNTNRVPLMVWNFREAYPVKWRGPELHANRPAVAVEAIDLVHRGISMQRISF